MQVNAKKCSFWTLKQVLSAPTYSDRLQAPKVPEVKTTPAAEIKDDLKSMIFIRESKYFQHTTHCIQKPNLSP